MRILVGGVLWRPAGCAQGSVSEYTPDNFAASAESLHRPSGFECERKACAANAIGCSHMHLVPHGALESWSYINQWLDACSDYSLTPNAVRSVYTCY